MLWGVWDLLDSYLRQTAEIFNEVSCDIWFVHLVIHCFVLLFIGIASKDIDNYLQRLREFSLSLYIFSLSFLLFYNNPFCPFVNFMIFCASLLLDVVMVFAKITYPTIAHSLKHIFHLFLLVGQNSPFLIHLKIIHCFFSFYIKISSFASRGNFS